MSFVYRLNAFAARKVTVKPARLAPPRAVASFTFDDFPISAWEVGGRMLEEHGARGTYYASAAYCERRVDGIDYYEREMLAAVHAAGHEVGCHSFSHEPAPALDDVTLRLDLARNEVFLREAVGSELGPLSYAHPYGLVCTRTKRLTGELYPSCRGIHPGLNGERADLAQLKAIPLERRSWRAETVERWIVAAKDAKAWIVFFTHDVADEPSPYGCTPQMLEHAFRTASAAGLDILPVRDALARATAAEPVSSLASQ